MRAEWIYLVVTVLKTKNNYRLRKFRPKSLAPNEFCYSFRVLIDEKEWFNRIEEVKLDKVSPPEISKLQNLSLEIQKPTSDLVMDRLLGKEGSDVVVTVIKNGE